MISSRFSRRVVWSFINVVLILIVLHLLSVFPVGESSVVKISDATAKVNQDAHKNGMIHNTFTQDLSINDFPSLTTHKSSDSSDSSAVTLTPVTQSPKDEKEKKPVEPLSATVPISVPKGSDPQTDQQASTNTTSSPTPAPAQDTNTTSPTETKKKPKIPTGKPPTVDNEPPIIVTPRQEGPVELDEGKVPKEKKLDKKKPTGLKPSKEKALPGFMPIFVGIGILAVVGIGYIGFQWIGGSRSVIERTIADQNYQPVETDDANGWNDGWEDDGWENGASSAQPKPYNANHTNDV